MTLSRLGLGVFLLLSACPAWAANVMVGQSTVAGANMAVAIPVTLSSGSGEEIVAIQIDLSFDTGSLTLGDVTAGTSAVAAEKDVSFSFSEEGIARIIVSGFNQTVISSGTIANLSLTTSSSISIGSHPLVCSEVVLSDALGNPVSGTGISGAINAGGFPPNVVGLTQTGAQTTLTSVGLAIGNVSLEYSNTVSAGLVTSQSPAASTRVAYGTTIDLVVSRGPQTVTVPNVVGMTQAQAQTALVTAGLILGTVTSEYNDTVAAGEVIRQAPSSGTSTPSDTAVAVVLSRGSATVTVPSVMGMTQTQAQTALAAVGLVLGPVTSEYSDTVAADLVLRQTPASGTTTSSGSAVAVVLSKGPQTPTVPNLAGMTQTQAQTALAAVGLVLGSVTSEYSDTVTADLVLRQTPASGTTTSSGSAVAVVLSKGPQTPTVPNLAGMTPAQAQTALAAVGLMLGSVTSEFSDTVAAGLVLRQAPSSGIAVSSGTAVAVVLSGGPQAVTVPTVIGMTQTQAQEALAVSGLVLGTVSNEYSSTVSVGIILSQEPAAGLEVVPGSPVNIVLSKGPQTVPVPSVAGMTQAAAQHELVAVGLVLGTITSQHSATVAAGVVITQDPAAGLSESPGTAVNLVVSDGPSTTSVPGVAGMSQTAAQNAITTAGLVLGTVIHEYSETVEAGIVIRQTPEAASTANAGDTVNIVVSDGPAPSGCFGGTVKALGQGSNGTNGLVRGAALTLLSIFGRP